MLYSSTRSPNLTATIPLPGISLPQAFDLRVEAHSYRSNNSEKPSPTPSVSGSFSDILTAIENLARQVHQIVGDTCSENEARDSRRSGVAAVCAAVLVYFATFASIMISTAPIGIWLSLASTEAPLSLMSKTLRSYLTHGEFLYIVGLVLPFSVLKLLFGLVGVDLLLKYKSIMITALIAFIGFS